MKFQKSNECSWKTELENTKETCEAIASAQTDMLSAIFEGPQDCCVSVSIQK